MTSQDEQLVQRHLLGDEGAFAELLQRHIRSVYNLAYRSTGNAMEAEHVVQEAFVRAYVALPLLQPGTPFKPWLLTIAINLCRNWARRSARGPATREPFGRDEGGADPLEQVPDPAPGPLAALLAAEAAKALEGALAALPLPYRQAIVLRYMEGLSYEEMAQALGLPLNTVRTHLHRAKARLRQSLVQIQGREGDGLPRDGAAPGSFRGRTTERGRESAVSGTPGQLCGLPEQSG